MLNICIVMAEYPDWLMKYKEKGVYVKKMKAGYCLYRGHSERTPDKNYPVFKCDEYIGMVTEQDGLIPSSPPVRPGITVLRYGYFHMAERCCGILITSLKKMRMNVGVIYTHALLGLEGDASQMSYAGSWLSRVYPDLNMDRALGRVQESMVERLKVQIQSKLEAAYGPDLGPMASLAANVYAVHVNGKWFTSSISAELLGYADKYGMDFSITLK